MPGAKNSKQGKTALKQVPTSLSKAVGSAKSTSLSRSAASKSSAGAVDSVDWCPVTWCSVCAKYC